MSTTEDIILKFKDAREAPYNTGSSSNCDGAEFMRYLASRSEALAQKRKEEQRQIRASDRKALGPVIGKLAQVFRKRRAAALNPEVRALAKSLRSRRRRIRVDLD